MSYRRYEPQREMLLPASLQDWLPQGHLAYFISDTVDALNLKAFYARYEGGGARNQNWPRLSKQHSPTFKWTAGGLQTVQSCPRRRSARATMRPTRWATWGAPGTSAYAAIAMMVGGCAK